MALQKFKSPALPQPGREYDQQYLMQLIRVLGIYFNQLDSLTPNQAQSYTADNFYGGDVTLTGFIYSSISSNVTAAGSTQTTATELVSEINNVGTVAAGANGVRLPTAVAGMRLLIRNSDSADSLSIYPATGGQINALGANVAYTLVAGSTVQLFANTTTQWFTF